MSAAPVEPANDDLPAYEADLAAFHRAFRAELRRAVRAVPFAPAARVLDVPCGNGFYSAALARRLAPTGALVAADLSPAYLRLARKTVARANPACPVEFAPADVYALPFPDASFDAVWCAQSFITFDHGVKALAEMRRVVRPGGVVAVLETDEYHRVIVNWPVGLELAVQRATAEASRAEYGTAVKLAPARKIGKLMRAAGLTAVRKRTIPADRTAPFDPATVAFLVRHFAGTRAFLAGHLTPDELAEFDRVTDPAAEGSLFRRPDAELTCVNTLFVGSR